MVLNGKGVRDTIFGIVGPKMLLYNDEDFMLEMICGIVSCAGGTKAKAKLTTNSSPADNDTVTIGDFVYTFKTSLTPSVKFEVLIGEFPLTNLKVAINYEAGVGQLYSQGTPAHPKVVAELDNSSLVVVSKHGGAFHNNIVTRAASQSLSWSSPTLIDGNDFKLTFGVCMNGESPEEGQSVMATGGELSFSNNCNVTKMANLVSNRVLLPKGSWLSVKSVAGELGELANPILFVKRRRLTGHL